MSRLLAVTLVTCATALALSACGGDEEAGGPVTLNWWAYNEPGGSFREAAQRCTKQSGGRYRIQFNALGNDPNTQRQSLVRRLAAGDSSIDLMSMDVIWTAEFAEAGWVKEWPADKAAQVREGTLEGPLATAVYEDKLYAAPANSNTQLLWYRKDLVDGEPPATWEGLIDDAAKRDKAARIEIQGADYEGIVVWFNSLVQSAGGDVLKLTREPTLEALNIMSDLARRAANPSISTQKEDQNRLAFEQGASVYQVNYPFIYPSARDNKAPIFEDIGWAPYPRVSADEPARAPIGGFNWGVGGNTEHPDEAFDAAICLRNEENQRGFALKGGLPPTLESLYDDASFKKDYPYGDIIRRQLDDAGVRPRTPFYADVSLAISTTVSPPGAFEPQAAYEQLKDKIDRALESKGLL